MKRQVISNRNSKKKQPREKHVTKLTTEHTIPAVEQVSSDNKVKESKPLVLIAEDSIIKDING